MKTQIVTYTHRSVDNLSIEIVKPRPANSLRRGILLIHGGGWTSGNKKEMEDIAFYLADKGFLAATADYRLAPASIWPAQLDDVQTAVRYLRAHAKELGIAPEKIGAAGVSAGAHLALFLGCVDSRIKGEYPDVSSRVQAVGCISGIHDLNRPLTELGESYHIVQRLTGEHGAVDRARRAEASPVTFFDSKTAPTMFIQGVLDPLVPPEQSTTACDQLKQLGVPSHLQFVEAMAHGLSPRIPLQAMALNQLVFWMFKYLK